jgi:riboflavin kinase/FMN adenylyltransferase
MRVIHDLENFIAPWSHSVVTLGVFDGIHRGHHLILTNLESAAPGERVLVTYDPHPDRILGKRSDKRTELFTYSEKIFLLQRYDIDTAVFLPFTRELSEMSAEEYLERILIQRLRASRIIIGYDQCFGKNRGGDYDFLLRMSDRFGYTVERIEAFRLNGEIVSSSLIRALIKDGQIRKANEYLGHDFFVSGYVVRGNRRGRELGFPTANLDIEPTKVIPQEGVYACTIEWGGRIYRAMTNVGRNPTFNQNTLTVEVNILDFDQDIYGENLRVSFKQRMRSEIRFSSVDALIQQLRRDEAVTRSLDL